MRAARLGRSGLSRFGGEGAHGLVDDDEALLGEFQSVVSFQSFDVATAEALPGAELADVVRKGVEIAVAADDVDLLVSHRADDVVAQTSAYHAKNEKGTRYLFGRCRLRIPKVMANALKARGSRSPKPAAFIIAAARSSRRCV